MILESKGIPKMSRYYVSIPEANIHGLEIEAKNPASAANEVMETVECDNELFPDRIQSRNAIKSINALSEFSLLVYSATPPLMPRVFVVRSVRKFEVTQAEGY